ncbi:hypothetical protein A3A71_03955 [Candidatus Berkelbacteria bacterium RIFCSPLOWO2_01_FULL_50_28]|uniref:Protoporphyrinogen IX oxidase n=1 Tax=Candidatus Berkelbacteria bacterium RIFCSPLOWO2_01_FULL_50_28 TaxID=1797471 RepID=A0A1F5EAL9_9BACT|nr:MAG: hypothetical protein A3F39_01320 [Candidatus Berkelbacteria bacterium RIFCSPHIGHO2_12_FULL_50_11]OGD64294.1 MAG: hypothetical protein A3A71_03955 [Candidatus Berkelbacteria bacterium RIFCSPLOWO2_01_FULL_50_28]
MELHDIVLLLHILGACVVVGVVFFSLAFSVSRPLDGFKLKAIKFVRRFGIYGMSVLVITGVYMAYVEWEDTGTNPWFWVKMGLIVLDYLVAVRLIDAKVSSGIAGNSEALKGLPVLTWASLVAFVVIVAIGRLYL